MEVSKMVKRTMNMDGNEPEQKKFESPSEGEHLMQVVDVYDSTNAPGKMVLDENTVCVKLEVAIGDELGRTILQRLSLDPTWKGFFATRLFLKAIGEEYKGNIEIDSDRWIGRQAYVNVVHNGKYANVSDYNFEKCAGLSKVNPGGVSDPDSIEWSE
jgi:hypothetical protein